MGTPLSTLIILAMIAINYSCMRRRGGKTKTTDRNQILSSPGASEVARDAMDGWMAALDGDHCHHQFRAFSPYLHVRMGKRLRQLHRGCKFVSLWHFRTVRFSSIPCRVEKIWVLQVYGLLICMPTGAGDDDNALYR